MRLAAHRNDGPVSAARQTAIAYPVQRNRLAGLRDGLAEVGVAWPSVPVWERFDHSVEAGQSAAAELLAAHPRSRRWSAPPTSSPSARCATPSTTGLRCPRR